MGFGLWIDGDVLYAQGLHEYRPMGVAVISRTGLFRDRDFRPTPHPPSRAASNYVGLFGSLVDLNDYCRRLQNGRQPVRRAAIPIWL